MIVLVVILGVVALSTVLLLRYRTEWVATKLAQASRRRANRRGQIR